MSAAAVSGGGTEEPLHVLWRSDSLQSLEHGRLERRLDGWLMTGVTVASMDGVPVDLDYRVATDHGWATRTVTVSMRAVHDRHLVVVTDGSIWVVDGRRRDDLAGCVDIDLGWTPATNTLAIRRLGLDIGEEVSTTVAWLQFPEFVLEATTQRYTRLGDRTWRFESGPYAYVLDVDGHGRVLRYGDGLWIAVDRTGVG